MSGHALPKNATPWLRGVSLVGLAITACISAGPSAATVDPGQLVEETPVIRDVDGSGDTRNSPFAFGTPLPQMPAAGLMAQATPPPYQVCTEGCEPFVGFQPPFPRPGDTGTPPPDGGVAPQAGAPVLDTPDLLVTKPRVVPDLDSRLSNGGNEEIW